ncbi:MAG: hybrid sensor histidine kinase/response regulator [Cyanobacteria bacterium P01_F01_bin.86]
MATDSPQPEPPQPEPPPSETLSADDADRLIFVDEAEGDDIESALPADADAWKIMLVDDEPSVHQATKVALKFFSFEDRPLSFVSAYSAAEARALIADHPDTALILLDVIMETQDAGLKVAQYIREELENNTVRIVLRTGQPGQVPEESVVVNYDINDYKTKLELTQQKLFTTLVSSLRAYRDLLALHESQAALQTFNRNLETIVRRRTRALEHEVAEREKAQEALKIYIHALTHDLRNPVTGMTAVLQSLIQQQQLSNEDPPSAKIPLSILERMNAGCDRQLKMINTLIESHAIEIWGVSLDPEPFEIQALISALVAEWQPRLDKKRIQVVQRVDASLDKLQGDRAQLWRVFENLIGNALKYNPPGMVLTISAKALKPNWIHCEIQDNGVGIAAEQCEGIFELYSRGTMVSPTRGLGIGLYICRRIVEAHGGQIGLKSQLNQGSTFWFDLPIEVASLP